MAHYEFVTPFITPCIVSMEIKVPRYRLNGNTIDYDYEVRVKSHCVDAMDEVKVVQWSVWRGFKDFQNLDKALRNSITSQMEIIAFCKLHRWRTFCKRNKGSTFLERRRLELECYMRKVASIPNITDYHTLNGSTDLANFFGLHYHVSVVENASSNATTVPRNLSSNKDLLSISGSVVSLTSTGSNQRNSTSADTRKHSFKSQSNSVKSISTDSLASVHSLSSVQNDSKTNKTDNNRAFRLDNGVAWHDKGKSCMSSRTSSQTSIRSYKKHATHSATSLEAYMECPDNSQTAYIRSGGSRPSSGTSSGEVSVASTNAMQKKRCTATSKISMASTKSVDDDFDNNARLEVECMSQKELLRHIHDAQGSKVVKAFKCEAKCYGACNDIEVGSRVFFNFMVDTFGKTDTNNMLPSILALLPDEKKRNALERLDLNQVSLIDRLRSQGAVMQY